MIALGIPWFTHHHCCPSLPHHWAKVVLEIVQSTFKGVSAVSIVSQLASGELSYR
jgi:hypothetical protein